jgi:hypothetical protein
MQSILIGSVSLRGSLLSSGGMVGSLCYGVWWEVDADMRVIKFSFVWCVVCCPFFVRDGQDGDCVLIFLCGKSGPMYGFMCVFCVV